MQREQKKEVVASMKEELSSVDAVIVTHYKGLTVSDMDGLRGKIREAGSSFQVTKNSLARLAVKGTTCEDITEFLSGPTAIAYSNDPVAVAKVVVDFAKENENLIILGGVVQEQVFDESAIKALSNLPSLDESRAKIVGILSTPASKIASVLQAPAGQVARVIAAKGGQEG